MSVPDNTVESMPDDSSAYPAVGVVLGTALLMLTAFFDHCRADLEPYDVEQTEDIIERMRLVERALEDNDDDALVVALATFRARAEALA